MSQKALRRPASAADGTTLFNRKIMRARYYTMAEAAAYCRQSIRTLHRAIKAGLLKSYLIRNRRRFLKIDLDAYLDGTVTTPPDFPVNRQYANRP